MMKSGQKEPSSRPRFLRRERIAAPLLAVLVVAAAGCASTAGVDLAASGPASDEEAAEKGEASPAKPAESAAEQAAEEASPSEQKGPIDNPWERGLNRPEYVDQTPADEEVEWLSDEEGREFRIERMPRIEGSYAWLPDGRLRIFGVTVDVFEHDEEWFSVKVYRTPDVEIVPYSTEPTEEEMAAVRATYDLDTPSADRLRFTPFDQGLPTRGQWRNGFEIADMNGDGHLDIVHCPPRKGTVWPIVFLGDGEGRWTYWSELSFPAEYDYGDVALADFNQDGLTDIALAIHLRGVRVLISRGDGSFEEWSEGIGYQIPGREGAGLPDFSSRAIEATDWNGDGLPDLVAVGEGPHPPDQSLTRKRGTTANPLGGMLFTIPGPTVFLNQGDGTWLAYDQNYTEQEVFGDSLAIADFDVDGRVDFATASHSLGRADIVHFNEEGLGWTSTRLGIRRRAYVRAVTAADFDADGRADLAVSYLSFEAAEWRGGIDVFYSRPDGWERRPLYARESYVAMYALAHGDVDGDGAIDLVATDNEGDALVWLGDGEGFFLREESPELSKARGRCRGYHLALADVDADGRDEVVASYAGESSPLFDPTYCPNEGGLTVWKAGPAGESLEQTVAGAGR